MYRPWRESPRPRALSPDAPPWWRLLLLLSVGVAVSAAGIAMAVAVALALALTLAGAIGVPVALTIALAFGLALAMALFIARAFALTVAVAVGIALALALTSVALEGASLSRALVTTGVALLLALLALVLPVGVVLSLPMLLRGLLALLWGGTLLRTGPECVAVAEVCRQRSLGHGDRHERVRLRVSVVTNRHLGRWVLSGDGGGV